MQILYASIFFAIKVLNSLSLKVRWIHNLKFIKAATALKQVLQKGCVMATRCRCQTNSGRFLPQILVDLQTISR